MFMLLGNETALVIAISLERFQTPGNDCEYGSRTCCCKRCSEIILISYIVWRSDRGPHHLASKRQCLNFGVQAEFESVMDGQRSR